MIRFIKKTLILFALALNAVSLGRMLFGRLPAGGSLALITHTALGNSPHINLHLMSSMLICHYVKRLKLLKMHVFCTTKIKLYPQVRLVCILALSLACVA